MYRSRKLLFGKGDIVKIKRVSLYPDEKSTGMEKFYGFAGCYMIKAADKLIYIGRSKVDVADAVTRHFQNGNRTQVKIPKKINYYTCALILTRTGDLADKLEKYLIDENRPELNKQVGLFDKKSKVAKRHLTNKIKEIVNGKEYTFEEVPF